MYGKRKKHYILWININNVISIERNKGKNLFFCNNLCYTVSRYCIFLFDGIAKRCFFLRILKITGFMPISYISKNIHIIHIL